LTSAAADFQVARGVHLNVLVPKFESETSQKQEVSSTTRFTAAPAIFLPLNIKRISTGIASAFSVNSSTRAFGFVSVLQLPGQMDELAPIREKGIREDVITWCLTPEIRIEF